MLDRLLALINELVLWFDQWKFAATDISIVPGQYVFIFLAGVTISMLAISYRFMRRVMAAFLLLAGLYAGVMAAFGSSGARADLEIYNSGTTQTVIVNDIPGTVIFRQSGNSRHDTFSKDLLPYLLRRNSPMPGYFVFAEPRYRTEQRLDLISATGGEINLRPCQVDFDDQSPSIWYREGGNLEAKTDSGNPIQTFPGAVSIAIADSGGLLIICAPRKFRKHMGERFIPLTYIVAVVRDSVDVAVLEALRDYHEIIILPIRPTDKYAHLLDALSQRKSGLIILGNNRREALLNFPWR
jgi:hypothetical protein